MAGKGGTIPGFHVILLAGGSGTRFWPLSRKRRPKQMLPLVGAEPLLVSTWQRVRKLAPPRRIWIVSPTDLQGQVKEMLPALRHENLIAEPSPRDTAPAIALACAVVERQDPGAIVGIFPTDHVVRDIPAFVGAVRVAAGAASKGSLLCLGVRPDRPATGFGYLKCASAPRRGRVARVDRFVEKPDRRRAVRYLRSGRYMWNGGMFVWKASRFLEELDRVEPDIGEAVKGHLQGRRGAWGMAPRVSVDYAVIEKASDLAVVPLDAGWDDVGSWDAAARLRAGGDRRATKHVLVDSDGAEVFADGRTVAVVGLPDVVVVDTPDALLVVARDSGEKVRDVVAQLRERRRADLI